MVAAIVTRTLQPRSGSQTERTHEISPHKRNRNRSGMPMPDMRKSAVDLTTLMAGVNFSQDTAARLPLVVNLKVR